MFLRLIILSTFLFVLPLNAVKYDKLNPSALYERAVKYLDKEDYSRAIRALKSYTKSEPEDADGWNLYAFAHRKVGKFDQAEKFYLEGLKIKPNHNGINEYLGELYVQKNQIDKANERLAVLKNCNCKEYKELELIIKNRGVKIY